MTLHWWMHWFWITVISIALALSVTHGAPYASIENEEPAELLNTDEPPKFHSDSSLYVALLHTAAPEEDADDTPIPGAVFPTVLIQHDYSPSEVTTIDEHYPQEDLASVHEHYSQAGPLHEHYPSPALHEVTSVHEHYSAAENKVTTISPKLDSNDNPMEEEVLSSETNEQTQVFARDISLSRNGKAIGRDFISTSPSTPAQVSSNTPSVTDSPKEQVSEVSSVKNEETTSAPQLVTEKIEEHESAEEHSSETSVTRSLAPPAWVASYSGEDEQSAVEASAEENAQPDASLAEDQNPAELNNTEISSEAITKGHMTAEQGLDAPSIIGIVVGLIGLLALVGGAVGFVLYRRQFLNKPQTLNDKCSNADSSGYIDDTLRVSASYLNSAGVVIGRAIRGNRVAAAAEPVEPNSKAQPMTTFPNKDNSEEMYSLDNDSFLNSLEAMTIQNYWTDSVKHTKL